MWQAFTNFFQGLQTYADLSPDGTIRRQVNHHLKQTRPALTVEDWITTFEKALGVDVLPALGKFLFDELATHSGLEVSRLRPSDRLIEDLHLPLVSWFDWPSQFCEDFLAAFQIDLSEDFDEADFETLKDLMAFLQEQLISMDSCPSR
ncbi:MAG: hypothetical protein O2890_06915 [Cyanobacteria bacterium]|nr:hypothetical protein [Cyanobacteriota bacterium]MDA0866136.1 hypothetical protein [Cyanobacteriota bacterium]